jgi:acyl-CoA dehydrogenase
MIDFELPAELTELRTRLLQFVKEKIVPLETDPRNGAYAIEEPLREDMVEMARQAGLLSPHVPQEYGGMGLDHRGIAVLFEAASWSPLGPLALNIQAPDEGNVNLINKIANAKQKAKWLPEIAAAKIRTAFSMTETNSDGAGSDPSLLQTRAQATEHCDGENLRPVWQRCRCDDVSH